MSVVYLHVEEFTFVFLVELSKNVLAIVTISRKECSFRKLNHHRLCVSRLFLKTSCEDWGFLQNFWTSVLDPDWARCPCIDCVWLHGTFSDFCDFSHGGYHCVTGYKMSDQSNTKLTAPPNGDLVGQILGETDQAGSSTPSSRQRNTWARGPVLPRRGRHMTKVMAATKMADEMIDVTVPEILKRKGRMMRHRWL